MNPMTSPANPAAASAPDACAATPLDPADYFGKDTPKLGFGLMRLPKLADGAIDVDQTARMVDAFLDAGFTYFDTAFVYEGSEEAIGRALVQRHPRESFTLATKLFAKRAATAEEAKQQLFTSLERTGAGYFDYYLMHNLGDGRTRYFEDYGLWEWAQQMKAQGLIRHVGFSMHADAGQLDEVLTAHPEVEFVQLQINYADWEDCENQSRLCYECAMRHGKPVVIMEPVKGGLLANPPQTVADVFRAADPQASCASWALRFAASLPGVITVLSGMSNEEQMADNLATFKDFKPLGEEGHAVIEAAQAELAKIDIVPCTTCRYCTKGCPQQINVPGAFSALNLLRVYGNEKEAADTYDWQTRDARANTCLRCGACESVCPQHLPICDLLAEVSELFDKSVEAGAASEAAAE